MVNANNSQFQLGIINLYILFCLTNHTFMLVGFSGYFPLLTVARSNCC